MCFMGIYSIVIALLKVFWTLVCILLLSTQIEGRSWYCWWHEIERANFVSKIRCMFLDRSHHFWWFDITCAGAISDSNLRSHACFWLCKVNARSSDMQALIGNCSGAWVGWNYYAGLRRLVLVRFQLFLHSPSDLMFYFSHVVTYSAQPWYQLSTAIQMCDPLNQSSPCTCSYGRWVWLSNNMLASHRVLDVLLRIRFICFSLTKCW